MPNYNITESDIEEGSIVDRHRPPLSKEEIKKLALAMYRGEIFTSMQVKEPSMLSMVFMVLMFMDEVQQRELIASGVVHFYAEMKDAGPRSVNGYPCFFGASTLTAEDASALIDQYNKIVKTMEEI